MLRRRAAPPRVATTPCTCSTRPCCRVTKVRQVGHSTTQRKPDEPLGPSENVEHAGSGSSDVSLGRCRLHGRGSDTEECDPWGKKKDGRTLLVDAIPAGIGRCQSKSPHFEPNRAERTAAASGRTWSGSDHSSAGYTGYRVSSRRLPPASSTAGTRLWIMSTARSNRLAGGAAP